MKKNVYLISIILSILFFLTGILLLIVGIINVKPENSMLYFNDVIKDDETGKYAYVNAVGVNSFARKGDDTYFFVQDNNKFVYIVSLSQETYALLYDEFMKEGDNFEYILKGYSKRVPDAIKQSAIEKFPELGIVNVTLDDDNFNDYLGGLYLDTNYEPNKTLDIVKITLGSIVTVLASLGFIIIIKKGIN